LTQAWISPPEAANAAPASASDVMTILSPIAGAQLLRDRTREAAMGGSFPDAMCEQGDDCEAAPTAGRMGSGQGPDLNEDILDSFSKESSGPRGSAAHLRKADLAHNRLSVASECRSASVWRLRLV
jgi:hypothetical protein